MWHDSEGVHDMFNEVLLAFYQVCPQQILQNTHRSFLKVKVKERYSLRKNHSKFLWGSGDAAGLRDGTYSVSSDDKVVR